jgi:large subunit ribosomal protein L35
MPKQKTHKGLVKRLKVSAGGKVMRKKAGKGHLMSGKSGGRKRSLRKTVEINSTVYKKHLMMLGGK